MRILLLIPTLTGAGAERQLAYLATELRRRGHEVLAGFIYPGPGEFPADIPTHRFAQRGAWNPLLIADVARLIRSWKPDVVQTCLPRMDVAGGIAAMLAGVPFVIREANAGESYRGPRALLRRLVGSRASAIIANSSGGAGYWRTPHMIPNAIPVDEIASTEPIAHDASPVAVYIGRLEPQKNVDVVIRACAAIPNLLLYVCGDGPERPRLEALSRELHANVRFTGFVANAWSYQRAADVALLVSEFEGHPNAIGECFAAGTPMVLSGIAPHRELAGDDALLVPPRDVEATAAAVRNVLSDRDAALRRAQNARRRISNSSIAAMTAAYENVHSLVAAGRRRPGDTRAH